MLPSQPLRHQPGLRRRARALLANGRGRALEGLTTWQTKAAVPFGGQYRIVDFVLSNCVNSEIRQHRAADAVQIAVADPPRARGLGLPPPRARRVRRDMAGAAAGRRALVPRHGRRRAAKHRPHRRHGREPRARARRRSGLLASTTAADRGAYGAQAPTSRSPAHVPATSDHDEVFVDADRPHRAHRAPAAYGDGAAPLAAWPQWVRSCSARSSCAGYLAACARSGSRRPTSRATSCPRPRARRTCARTSATPPRSRATGARSNTVDRFWHAHMELLDNAAPALYANPASGPCSRATSRCLPARVLAGRIRGRGRAEPGLGRGGRRDSLRHLDALPRRRQRR